MIARFDATGALHLPLGSAMQIERDASGAIVGVRPRGAHFSDRGRLFQSDRARQFSLITDGWRGLRAGGILTSPNVAAEYGAWALTGHENAGPLQQETLRGQTWLIEPATSKDLRHAENEWGRLTELVEELKGRPGAAA